MKGVGLDGCLRRVGMNIWATARKIEATLPGLKHCQEVGQHSSPPIMVSVA